MEDMYDSQPGAGEEMPEGAEPREEGQEEQGDPVLVNSSLCPDAKPGETLMVKVGKIHGEEMELTYVGKQEGEEGPPEEGGDMPPEAKGSPYASMME